MPEYIRICPKCAEENPEGATTCENCAHFLGMVKPVPSSLPTPPAPGALSGSPIESLNRRTGQISDLKTNLEQYRTRSQPLVLTLLLARAAPMSSVEDAERTVAYFHDLMQTYHGQCLSDAGGRLLAAFSAPSEAVRFALALLAGLRGPDKEPLIPNPPRIGLHQGQIAIQGLDDDLEDVSDGPIQSVARLAEAAALGQILCSRAVYDQARAVLHPNDLVGLGRVAWRIHGPRQLAGMLDPQDICEVGDEAQAPFTLSLPEIPETTPGKKHAETDLEPDAEALALGQVLYMDATTARESFQVRSGETVGQAHSTSNADVQLSNVPNVDYISREHCRFDLEEHAWFITALPSGLNGTFVNREPLKRGDRARVRDGDEVMLANVPFRIRLASS